MFFRAGDLGWSLLTGGRCSQVAVSTGLTPLLSAKLAVKNMSSVKLAVKNMFDVNMYISKYF